MDRKELIHLIMEGRESMGKDNMARVANFRSRGRKNYYWWRAAEFTAKASIRDYLEKAWNYL